MQSVLAIIPFPLPVADNPAEGVSENVVPQGALFSLDAGPALVGDLKIPAADSLPAMAIPAFWPLQVASPPPVPQTDAMATAVAGPVLPNQTSDLAKAGVSGAAVVVPAPIPRSTDPVASDPLPSAGLTLSEAADQDHPRAGSAVADGVTPTQDQPKPNVTIASTGSGRPEALPVPPLADRPVLGRTGGMKAAPTGSQGPDHTVRTAMPADRATIVLPPGLTAPTPSDGAVATDSMVIADLPAAEADAVQAMDLLSVTSAPDARPAAPPASARPLAATEVLWSPEPVPSTDADILPVQSTPDAEIPSAHATPSGVAPTRSAPAAASLTEGSAPPDRPAAPAAGFWERFFTALPGPPDAEALPGHVSVAVPVLASLTTGLIGSPKGQAEERTSQKVEPDPEPDLRPRAGPKAPELPASPLGPKAGAPDPILLPDAARTIDASSEDAAFGAMLPVASAAPTPSGSTTAPLTLPVPQVAAQITAALFHDRAGVTELALAPEELGHVRLRLEPDAANPDRMVVMISVERPETLDLFRRHAADLAEALRAAGYAGADIGFGQQRDNDRPDQRHARTDSGPAAGPDPVTPPPAPSRRAAGASLDLRL